MQQTSDKKKELHVDTSFHCNNYCLFCLDRMDNKFLKSRKDILVDPDNHIEFRKLLERRKADVDELVFTSGEPTLNKELKNYVRTAKEIGYTEILLITNGRMLCYPDLCEELIVCGITKFNVSIHGHNKTIHQAHTRCNGSFHQTAKGLFNLSLLKRRYIFKFNTISVITKLNYKHILELLVFLSKFNPDEIQLNPVIPSGNALSYFDKVVPLYSEVAASIKNAVSRFNAFKSYLYVQHLPMCLMENEAKYLIVENYILGQNAEAVGRPGKSKGEKCVSCLYDRQCEGVFDEYVRRMGWGEFVPVGVWSK